MSKPLTDEQKATFEAFATERFEDEGGAFSVGEVLDLFDNPDEWDFHASNHAPDDQHDLYELFDSCPRFVCEADGYEDFYVVER